MQRCPLLCLVLLVGCGRLGFEGEGESEDDGVGWNDTTVADMTANTAPSTCESFTGAVIGSADVDIAVSETPTGAAVFWAPATGGDLSGFELDLSMQATAPTVVRSGTSFDKTAASYVDGKLIVTARTGTRALIHDVPLPLAPGAEIANFWGDHIGKQALVTAGSDRIMAASCSVMDFHAFDQTWAGAESTFSSPHPDSSDHVDITAMGTRAFIAVSMPTGCHIGIAMDRNNGDDRLAAMSCQNARVASDGVDRVAMVFENEGAVELVVDASATLTPTAGLPLALGSEPRVLRHGDRFWLAFLDDQNRIVIGYIVGEEVQLRTLTQTAAPGAYELTVFDGSPWLFSVDPQSTTFVGQRLCEAG